MLKKKILIATLIIFSLVLIGCKEEVPKKYDSINVPVGEEKDAVPKNDDSISVGTGEDNGQKKYRSPEVESKIKELVQRAEEMVMEKNWTQAGSYLYQALELSDGEGILEMDESVSWQEKQIIEALMAANVFTMEDTRLFIEKEEFRRPEEPKIAILEREGEKVLEWFGDYRKWFMDMLVIPRDYYFDTRSTESREVVFLEDTLNELTEIRRKYMKEGYDEYFGLSHSGIELGEKTFYYYGVGGIGGLCPFSELSNPEYSEVLDFEARETEVFFKIRYKATAGYHVWEGIYNVTYEIERKEDGTFRVGDYTLARVEQ